MILDKDGLSPRKMTLEINWKGLRCLSRETGLTKKTGRKVLGSLFQYKGAELINALRGEREMKGEGELRCASEEVASVPHMGEKEEKKKNKQLRVYPMNKVCGSMIKFKTL